MSKPMRTRFVSPVIATDANILNIMPTSSGHNNSRVSRPNGMSSYPPMPLLGPEIIDILDDDCILVQEGGDGHNNCLRSVKPDSNKSSSQVKSIVKTEASLPPPQQPPSTNGEPNVGGRIQWGNAVSSLNSRTNSSSTYIRQVVSSAGSNGQSKGTIVIGGSNTKSSVNVLTRSQQPSNILPKIVPNVPTTTSSPIMQIPPVKQATTSVPLVTVKKEPNVSATSTSTTATTAKVQQQQQFAFLVAPTPGGSNQPKILMFNLSQLPPGVKIPGIAPGTKGPIFLAAAPSSNTRNSNNNNVATKVSNANVSSSTKTLPLIAPKPVVLVDNIKSEPFSQMTAKQVTPQQVPVRPPTVQLSGGATLKPIVSQSTSMTSTVVTSNVQQYKTLVNANGQKIFQFSGQPISITPNNHATIGRLTPSTLLPPNIPQTQAPSSNNLSSHVGLLLSNQELQPQQKRKRSIDELSSEICPSMSAPKRLSNGQAAPLFTSNLQESNRTSEVEKEENCEPMCFIEPTPVSSQPMFCLPPLPCLGTPGEKLLQIYLSTLGATVSAEHFSFTPALPQYTPEGNWIYQRFYRMYHAVVAFHQLLIELVQSEEKYCFGIPDHLEDEIHFNWLDVLLIRSCYHSIDRNRVAWQARDTEIVYRRRRVWFEPNENEEIAVRLNGEKPSITLLLDEVSHLYSVVYFAQLDQMELALISAYLIFASEPDNVVVFEGGAGHEPARSRQLRYMYRLAIKKIMLDHYGSIDELSKFNNLALHTLPNLAIVSGVSELVANPNSC